jgi:hypothetical protein
MEAQNKGRTAIEATQRAEDTAKRTRGLGAFDTEAAAGRKSAEDRRKDLVGAQGDFQKAASSKYTADMGLAQQTLANMGSKEVAEIHARSAAATANRPGEQERMLAKYLDLRAKDPKAAEMYMQSFERMGLKGNEPRQTQEQSSAKAALPSATTALANAEKAFSMMFARLPKEDPSRIAAQKTLDEAKEALRALKAAAGIGDSSPVASGIAAPAPAPAKAMPASQAPQGGKEGKVVPGKGTEWIVDGKVVGYMK